jgi:hypothetical protein
MHLVAADIHIVLQPLLQASNASNIFVTPLKEAACGSQPLPRH